MLRKITLSVYGLIAGISIAFGQTQIIRGTVKDADSNYPMVGVTVIVMDTDPILGAVTDINGQYEIKNVPLGRIDLTYSFVGYKDTYLKQQLLEIGKELVLNVYIEEDIQAMDEVVVTASQEHIINNEAALASVRTFDVEETRRYAGSRNDIARMASNYAGVSNADDSRNDIVIRGNSPVSLLWRLDGIDIPSPNHYNTMGSTGGPVSILNNNNLANSDFITSAFPASYGNTVSGVFDLELKKGNAFTHEYTGQIGFNGFELGAEGPFTKSSKATYMANYRYSTLGVFKALGIDFGTGTAVPQYQDLTFALDLTTEKAGSFKLFGIGGISQIHFEPVEETDAQGNFYSTEDLKNNGQIGVIGLKHTYYFNSNNYWTTSIATSYQHSEVVIDSLQNNPINQQMDDVRQNQSQTKYSINSKYVSKINARNKLEAGVNLNYYDVNYQDSVFFANTNEWFKYTETTGGTLLTQAFAQYQYKFNEKARMVGGLHFQLLELTKQSAIEPRFGFLYQATTRTQLSLGYGLHSQIQPLVVNFWKFKNTPDSDNTNVGFTRSHHFSAGVDQHLGQDFHIKLEGYYQHLFEVPIESVPSSYSILNSGTSFGFALKPNMVNEGFGKNYGLELTIEKYFSKNYYFLLTTSLFESKYQGSDGVWRNTAFNNQYIVNLLGGTEFHVGKSGVLTTDLKLTFSGGRFHTPIDLNASNAEGEAVYIDSEAYSLKYDPYFRTDFKIGYRVNMKKISQEWLIDFQNLFNRQNIFEDYYNPQTQTIDQRYQLGLFIIPQYRILF